MAEYIVGKYEEEFLAKNWSRREGAYERLVRCKDCKYSQLVFNTFTGFVERQCFGYLVTIWDYENDKPLDNPVSDNSFCSWGEMS